MIWNSIPLMTAIDLLIIAVTTYAIWRCRLIGPSKRPSAPQAGLRLIVLGLVGICLFYFVDLLSMYVTPAVMSRQAAWAFMDTLHQNVSWFAVLFAMIAISSGFIELRRTQIELAEKTDLLADLSKLAKFLPGQLYNSIFTGSHSARVRREAEKADDLLLGHRQFRRDHRQSRIRGTDEPAQSISHRNVQDRDQSRRHDRQVCGGRDLGVLWRSHEPREQVGGILVAHETSSLIKDTILTEEQEPVSVKGFAHPVRVYKVVGIYDELEKDSRIIREERQGIRLLVDLTKGDLASAIAAVESVLARLRS